MDETGYSDKLLNTALTLVTEWGENYGKPIDERILRVYPDLSPADIAELVKRSREAEHHIYGLAEQELDGKIGESDITKAALERFPWLDGSNAARLKNIGMFYARK